MYKRRLVIASVSYLLLFTIRRGVETTLSRNLFVCAKMFAHKFVVSPPKGRVPTPDKSTLTPVREGRVLQIASARYSSLDLRAVWSRWPSHTGRLPMSFSVAVKFDGPKAETLSVILGNSTGASVIVELRDPTADLHTLKRFVLLTGEKAKVLNFSSRGQNWVPSIHFMAIIE
jgi:hypothetical protein